MSQHLIGLPGCFIFGFVLLSSCSLQCLALRNAKESHIRELREAIETGENLESIANVSVSALGSHASSPQASNPSSEDLHGPSTVPSGRPLNTVTPLQATLQIILGAPNLSEHDNPDAYPTAVPGTGKTGKAPTLSRPTEGLDKTETPGMPFSPAAAHLDSGLMDDGFNSSAGNVQEVAESVVGAGSTGQPDEVVYTPSVLEGHSDTPQLTVEEGRGSLLGAEVGDPFTSPFPPTSQPLDFEQVTILASTDTGTRLPLAAADAVLHLEAETSTNWEQQEDTSSCNATAVASALPQSEEWDDTKLGPMKPTQAVAVAPLQGVTEAYRIPGREEEEEEEEEDEVKKFLPPKVSATSAKGSKVTQGGSGQPPTEEETLTSSLAGPAPVHHSSASGKVESRMEKADLTFPSQWLPETVTSTDVTKSEVFQTSRNYLRGVTQASHEIAPDLPAVTPQDFTTQGGLRKETAMEEERELATQAATVSSTSKLRKELENSPTNVSPLATHLPVDKTGEAEGVVPTLGKGEGSQSLTSAPEMLPELRTQVEGILETVEAMTGPPSSVSSARRATAPAAHRITTAATYGLDRLESEEEEEEDEEEEEEEEEEPEEEEEEDEEDDDNEDDRDLNSMDESLDEDINLSSFTLPGEISQEPLEGLENPAGEISGVSYQLPNAIEWEQQNQGLVRSWMEKLKDKAGYMSGMLVPVGVGIAGALFILGALYSIKIMNRRRRNGFKRHKRKQREFNSMQDQVMLLADSSEDEF